MRQPIGGSTVVITGAARGIGERLALTLAGRGARVALVGLEPERLADVAARCGPNAAWWAADVTDSARMAEVADQVAERFSRIDTVVANAGIAAGGPLLLADPDAYDRVIEVNLLGSIRTARAFLPRLVESRGYFHQVASMAAFSPSPLMGAYCASKAGVESFAHSLRTEMAHHGVAVGVSYFSWTDTDMVRGADETPELTRSRTRLPGPLGKLQPLGPAVERMADGIERRAGHVYGQRYIRGLSMARAAFPAMFYLTARRDARETEEALRPLGPKATLPVGAGGRADSARAGTGTANGSGSPG